MSAALKEWRRAARAYAANNFESEALLEAGEALASEFTALRSQTLDEAARVADVVEGHFAAKTAIENHGKWTIGSDAARKIADAIRALRLPPG